MSVSAQIVSNLAESADSFTHAGNVFSGFNIDFGNASTFTTGSNSGGYTLTSATISFNDTEGSPANIQVTVNSDSGGDPGASLGTLAGANPTTAANYTFTNAGISLSANTTYFLTLLASGSPTGSSNRYNAVTTFSDNETTSDGWSIGDGGRSTSDGGANWGVGLTMKFSVTATPVPEPHEYAMFVGLGLVGFVVARRHMVSKALA